MICCAAARPCASLQIGVADREHPYGASQVSGSCRFDTLSTTTRTGRTSASDADPAVLAQCRLHGTTSSSIRDVSGDVGERVRMHWSGSRSTRASILHRSGRIVPRCRVVSHGLVSV